MSESRNQISELVATVEAVGEFGKIARPIFLTPGVVGAIQGPLDVAEHRVHPPQARRLAAARPPSGYPRAVLTSCFLHSPGESRGRTRPQRRTQRCTTNFAKGSYERRLRSSL